MGCGDSDDTPCESGQTGFRSCGINDRGRETRTCQSEQWSNYSACEDTDVCEDEDTETRECGVEGNGTEERTCVEGQWSDYTLCQDPDDVCSEVLGINCAQFEAASIEELNNIDSLSSVDSDGDTLVIGIPGDSSSSSGINNDETDSSAGSSGAVYVFVQEDGEWSRQAYIKASNTDAGDSFGTSVSISGDTLAVGAIGEDSGQTDGDNVESDNSSEDSGAAYVFIRKTEEDEDPEWTQQAYLKASNADEADQFGTSISLDGDVLAIGASKESSASNDQTDDSASGSGAVYVFTRTDETWSEQAYLKASSPNEGDNFGSSLSLSGDSLAVGAQLEDSAAVGVDDDEEDSNRAEDSGAVYIFTQTDTEWTQQAYIKASNTNSKDYFGVSLALDGDTLAIGAQFEDSSVIDGTSDENDNSNTDSGAVYVFTRTDAVWTQEAYIKASNADSFDRFGESLSLDGDTLAIGASSESSPAAGLLTTDDAELGDNTAPDSGATYVFTREDGAWNQLFYLKAPETTEDNHFGQSVILSGGELFVGSKAGVYIRKLEPSNSVDED